MIARSHKARALCSAAIPPKVMSPKTRPSPATVKLLAYYSQQRMYTNLQPTGLRRTLYSEDRRENEGVLNGRSRTAKHPRTSCLGAQPQPSMAGASAMRTFDRAPSLVSLYAGQRLQHYAYCTDTGGRETRAASSAALSSTGPCPPCIRARTQLIRKRPISTKSPRWQGVLDREA